MLLEVKNIGKISHAQIELNGITVIAGVNNTGKSTVGKVLFCLSNSFFDIDQQIANERINRIIKIIRVPALDEIFIFDPPKVRAFAESLVSKSINYENAEELSSSLLDYLNNLTPTIYSKIHMSDSLSQSLSKKIMQILGISDDELIVLILRQWLQREFNMQVGNACFPDLDSEISLAIEDKKISIAIQKDDIIIKNHCSLGSEAIYIDDPLAADGEASYLRRWPSFINFNHREHLMEKLIPIDDASPLEKAFDAILVSKKLNEALAILYNVCKGDLIKSNVHHNLIFATQEGNQTISLEMKNVSTGMKSFIILKTLLLNGSLRENGILILDEPEIHLHPEWQLVFAELIVLLQKIYNMRVLLTTHSPYFLDAIDVYSRKHGTEKK